jgi:hypothetical protein
MGSFIICTHQNKESDGGTACGTHGRGKKVYRVLVGKPEGKRQLERTRGRWEDGIKMDVRDIGCGVWSGFT